MMRPQESVESNRVGLLRVKGLECKYIALCRKQHKEADGDQHEHLCVAHGDLELAVA